MAGNVHITMGRDGQPQNLSLADRVTSLRQALESARERNDVDAGTYAEAQQVLDEAARLTEPAGEEERGAFVRALRKLKGLVEDVGGLAGAVTAVIAVVTGQR
ncbi:hypothetical protein ABZ896_14815 [Streptomyces sp. NPDC047072]|uniref:hypothetical protein n=1 Tax=Streptomyces sp. NPDC047072 TaxID=3154809 RepID=UPI0034025F35